VGGGGRALAEMQLAFVFACHAVTSSTLTLLNKRIAISVTFPWLAVLLQCLGTVFISLLMDMPFRTIKPIRFAQMPGALLISSLFTLSLASSISGLRRVHVPMAVVGKNLTPFVTAILETLLLKAPLGSRTVMSLVVGTCGGCIYLLGDANASAQGLFFVMLNALCVALTCISEKFVTDKKQQSPLGLSLLRNALAVPFVGLFLLADPAASLEAWEEILTAGPPMWVGMLLTASFGAVSGMLLFHLQSRVTATSTQVASLCYKLASTLLSLLVFPASRNDVGWLALLGYAVSTASISLYVFSKK